MTDLSTWAAEMFADDPQRPRRPTQANERARFDRRAPPRAPPTNWTLPSRESLRQPIAPPRFASSPFAAGPAPTAEPFPFPGGGRPQAWEVERRRQFIEQNPGATIGAVVGARPAPPDLTPPPDVLRAPEGRPGHWVPRVPGRADPPRSAFPFPGVSQPGAPIPEAPLEMAARVSGAPYGYLRALSGQEGLDDPNAKNPRSSATGLMQFTEGTWLQMLAEHGGEYGLPSELLRQIERKANGSGYTVRNPVTRAELMDLRRSPYWSALLGGQLYNQSADTLEAVLQRPVSPAEVYAGGHFLGEDAGAYMLGEVDNGRGARDAREAIRAYYLRTGQPRQAELVIQQNPRQFREGNTVADVMSMQTADFIEHGVTRGADRNELERPRGLSSAPYRQERPVLFPLASRR